jgi:pilus assembly protein CpaB
VNSRRIINAFILAFVVSVASTYFLSRSIKRRAEQPKHELLKYAAAVKDLPVGELLKAEDLKLVDWPSPNPIRGAFSRPEDVVGRALLYPVAQDQPLTDKYLSAAGSGFGLAGKIPAGMRAIALRSDEVVGVAGFLMPGSHVDVLVTYRSNTSPDPMTATVLQNAEVIAVGHQVTPDPEGKPGTATVVTLLLTPDEAERAVLATTQGSVHFVLRNGLDRGLAQSKPMMLSQLSGTVPTAQKPAVRGAPHRGISPQEEDKVETILGDKASVTAAGGGSKL